MYIDKPFKVEDICPVNQNEEPNSAQFDNISDDTIFFTNSEDMEILSKNKKIIQAKFKVIAEIESKINDTDL